MSNNDNNDDQEQNRTDSLPDELRDALESVGSADEALDLDAYEGETLTVEVPITEVGHAAFALWAGEINLGLIGEAKADEAGEHLREQLIDGLLERDDDPVVKLALATLKGKMVSYGEWVKKENGDGKHAMSAMLSRDDVPEHVGDYLEGQADGDGFGSVDMSDPDMPDDVRDWFKDYIADRIGADPDDIVTASDDTSLPPDRMFQ